MKSCRWVRRRMIDLLDAGQAAQAQPELLDHLRACAACRREYQEMEEAFVALDPACAVRASEGFKERVMNRLTQELTAAQTAGNARRTPWPAVLRLAAAGAVALALILGLPYLSGTGKRGSPPAAALLAQSIESMGEVHSVHISARMRTLARDNFDMIGLQYDLLPVELWKESGSPARWRVEKPGRVAVMDGASTLMFIAPDTAIRGGPRTGFVEWFRPLLDADKLLETELREVQSDKIAANLAEEQVNGARQIVLRMSPKAKGDFTNDWLRNKYIPQSDHRRIYRFDPATKRLEGLQVFVGDVLVFETTEIRYNENFDAAVFALALPPGVTPREAGALAPTTRPLPQTPRETAVRFFDSLAARDWEGAESVSPRVSDLIKRIYGGLTVISVGEPFRSGLYPGWFVPYEITMPDGHHKKYNLAVRNDNREHRWQVDGGY